MEQTAVEWLIEQLTPSISLQQKHIDDLKDKAKQMEKEQIIESYRSGRVDQQSDRKSASYNRMAAQHYDDFRKQEQKKHITDIMQQDEKDGLYQIPELSDEEINNIVDEIYPNANGSSKLLISGFKQGCRWYREQLKPKQ